MSEVMDAILKRRSIRRYKPDMPPKEAIDQIMQAGIFAANAMGQQSAVVVAIKDKALRDRLEVINGEIAGRTNPQFYGAPIVLLVLADGSTPNAVQDGSLVLGNMMIAAHDIGLGSCWVNRARQTMEMPIGDEIREKLGLSSDYIGVGYLVLGYIDGEYPDAKPRKENRIFNIA